jgi:hypothetical protein
MTMKLTFSTDKKEKIRRSPHAADGLRFSCAGTGCLTRERCARWNRIYSGKYRSN